MGVPGYLSRATEQALGAVLAGAEPVLDRGRDLLADAARTARFVRQRQSFRTRPNDIFIASYPRSGTTWAQAIVHFMLGGGSSFDFEHVSDVVPWWERTLAYRDDANRLFEGLPSPRAFKTHLVPTWLPEAAARRVIYLHRDPARVVESYFHLYRDYLGFTGTLDEFAARMRAGRVQYGSQAGHLDAWRGAAGDILWVAYEDLVARPQEQIRRMAEFLGLPVGSRRVEELANLTSFDTMKRHERRFDHLGELARQRRMSPGRFLRQGPSSQPPASGRDADVLECQRSHTTSSRVPIWKLFAYLR